MNNWTLDGFVDYFDFFHNKMLDHKIVWVLGAGASRSSGIQSGGELVDLWLSELCLRENHSSESVQEWASATTLNIPEFTYANRARFYTDIYQRRFFQYPDEGFAYLEAVMRNKDPSPGYSILASALAQDPPRHNAVITTNFDNLIADALAIYTDTFPFVCGHESLTGFVRVAMRRPLICKIHRDLLLSPQNDPRSLKRLHDAWGLALRSLFEYYTPLFIGYGGNDDTLMDLLESLTPGDIKGQLIWCYHAGSNPSERIRNIVTDHRGILVPIPDFDLLMVLLGDKMGIRLLDDAIEDRARMRAKRYRDRVTKLDTVQHPSVTEALAATYKRSGGWWAWQAKANTETDLARKETVLRQGIQHYPNSDSLCTDLAMLLGSKNLNEAEEFFKKAAEIEPKVAVYQYNYGECVLAAGRIDDAEVILKRSKQLVESDAQDLQASLELCFAAISELRGNDPSPHFQAVHDLLKNGFEGNEWDFTLLTHAVEPLTARKKRLYKIVAPAIVNPDDSNEALIALASRLKGTQKDTKA